MSGRTPYIKNAICPLCGTEIQTFARTGCGYVEPRYTFDLRSNAVEYMTLHSGLHCCTGCGYVFAEEDKTPDNANEIINTEAYKTCDDNDFGEKITAEKYYKYALIQLESDNFFGAFYAFLFGAWVCDDYKNNELSVMFRKKALEVFDILWEECEIKEQFFLIRADLLRRTGQFDKVVEEYAKFDSLDEDRVMVARIQVMLSKYKDDRCHFFPEYSALIS